MENTIPVHVVNGLALKETFVTGMCINAISAVCVGVFPPPHNSAGGFGAKTHRGGWLYKGDRKLLRRILTIPAQYSSISTFILPLPEIIPPFPETTPPCLENTPPSGVRLERRVHQRPPLKKKDESDFCER